MRRGGLKTRVTEKMPRPAGKWRSPVLTASFTPRTSGRKRECSAEVFMSDGELSNSLSGEEPRSNLCAAALRLTVSGELDQRLSDPGGASAIERRAEELAHESEPLAPAPAGVRECFPEKLL